MGKMSRPVPLKDSTTFKLQLFSTTTPSFALAQSTYMTYDQPESTPLRHSILYPFMPCMYIYIYNPCVSFTHLFEVFQAGGQCVDVFDKSEESRWVEWEDHSVCNDEHQVEPWIVISRAGYDWTHGHMIFCLTISVEIQVFCVVCPDFKTNNFSSRNPIIGIISHNPKTRNDAGTICSPAPIHYSKPDFFNATMRSFWKDRIVTSVVSFFCMMIQVWYALGCGALFSQLVQKVNAGLQTVTIVMVSPLNGAVPHRVVSKARPPMAKCIASTHSNGLFFTRHGGMMEDVPKLVVAGTYTLIVTYIMQIDFPPTFNPGLIVARLLGALLTISRPWRWLP